MIDIRELIIMLIDGVNDEIRTERFFARIEGENDSNLKVLNSARAELLRLRYAIDNPHAVASRDMSRYTVKLTDDEEMLFRLRYL